MQLELTKSEMERLLEIAYLGEEVLNGHGPDGKKSVAHDGVLQKIHELAEDEGLGYLVERDVEGVAKPSMALDARMESAGFLQAYDDCVFWDELALRLAERDLRDKIGKVAFEAMPTAERDALVDNLADAYDHQFDARGLDGLRLDGFHIQDNSKNALIERLKKLFKDSK